MALYEFTPRYGTNIGDIRNWSYYANSGSHGAGFYDCVTVDNNGDITQTNAPLPSAADTVDGNITGSGSLTVGVISGFVELSSGTLGATQITSGAEADSSGTIDVTEIDGVATVTSGGFISATTIDGPTLVESGGSVSAGTISGTINGGLTADNASSVIAQTVYGGVSISGGSADISAIHPLSGGSSVSLSVTNATLTFGGFGGDPPGTTYGLLLSAGATLTGQGWNVAGINLQLIGAALTAATNVSASSLDLSSGALFTVDGDFSTSGGVNIGSAIAGQGFSSATLVCDNATISSNDSDLDVVNAAFTVSGNLTLDNGDLGSLLGQSGIGSGALNVVGTLDIGGVPVGSFFPSDLICSDNSTVSATDLIIGDAGSGRILNGDTSSLTISAGNVVLGNQAGATGQIVLNNDSDADFSADALTIGSNGTGYFDQDGIALVYGNATIGAGSGFGSLNVAGTTTVQGAGGIVLGSQQGGTGYLDVAGSGASLHATGITVGEGGVGNATVAGGATAIVSGGVQVGGGTGKGTLIVAGSNTTLDAADIMIGGLDALAGGTGTLAVTSNGLTSGVLVESGGFAFANTGGTLESSIIDSGGSERIVGEPTGSGSISGGMATGTTVIGGGTMELYEASAGSGQQPGAVSELVNGDIAFEGSGGVLKLGGATISTDTLADTCEVSGFTCGDTIDLTSVGFSGGGAVYLSSGSVDNVLTIVESGGTALLQLDPSQDFSSVSFRLSSDSTGSGTDVTAVSGLSINLSYDSSVASAPGGYDGAFTSAMAQVVSTFEADFSNPDTINISIGWGEEDNNVVSGGGQSQADALSPYSYADVRSALLSGAQSPTQIAADATLPVTDPTSGGQFSIAVAEAQALGLIDNNGTDINGWVGFGAGDPWSFAGSGTTSGQEDFIATAEHELSEVMGRVSDLNEPNTYSPMDLFRFAGPGYRDDTEASADLLSGGYPASYPTAYFSINNGATNLGTWNNYAPNGDLGDWYPTGSPVPNDAFDYVDTGAGYSPLSATDLALMNVMGWDLSGTLPTLSGTPFFNTEVTSGDALNISSGGDASDTVVFDGGTMNVQSGGSASGTIVFSGGIMTLLLGGMASGSIISGGTQIVDSGGSASDLVMSGSGTISGGTLELLSGASGGSPIFFAGSGGTLKIDGPGNDTISGSAPGPNTVDYTNLSTPGLVAIVAGVNGTVNKGAGNGTDTLHNVQHIVDNGTGRANGDVFEVYSGETVTANIADFNYLIELSANVNLSYGTSFTGITEYVGNTGTNTVSFASDPNFAYVYGSTGNDTLTLGSGGGYLFGEGGTNVLTGGANATNLFVGGGGGSDTMNGGGGSASNYYYVDGNDQVNGAGAFNTMIELVNAVTIQLGSAQYRDIQEFVADNGANVVTVANSDAGFKYLYGGAGNDTLTTGTGGGYLFGEGGTNTLTGGGGLNVFVADGASGIDTMNGGTGNNDYFIDSHSIVHGAGTFNTVIELQQSATLTLGSAQLGSDIQEVVLNGGANTADFHTATSAVFLYAGPGTNTLTGGTGNDFLYGSSGTTTFAFKQGWGKNTIMSWAAGTNNQIDLTALASLGVHAIGDLTQTIVNGSDVITSSHTGTNSITLNGIGSTLSASSFKFA